MIASLHRPTQALVDLEAIKDNIESVKNHLPKGKQVFAVVKADAYGHGAVRVVKSIATIVDGFCVSNLDEAIQLRQEGMEQFILVLGVTMPQELTLAKKYNITVTVSSLEWVHLVESSDVSLDGLSVHVKVDSGMGRIGVRSLSDADNLIAILKSHGAAVTGIFTHFATADEEESSKFEEQITFFTDLIANLKDKPDVVHASNSATTLWHQPVTFDAVRLGIVAYGLNPSGCDLSLPYTVKPALSLESQLIHVKEIEKGDTVGYGATYKAEEKQFIGTIPIGYADGWTRDMQGFSVLIDGEFCPIVGRISMDQTTLRLPKRYPIGTTVTLIGTNGGNVISATDVAEKRGTINYEVLCLIGERVPRYYI